MSPRAVAFALLLASPCAAFAEAAPTQCDDTGNGAVRSCHRLDDGSPGSYVTTPLAFAYVGTSPTQVGAGSLAGAAARADTQKLFAGVYAGSLLTMDSIGARVTWGDGKGGELPNDRFAVETFYRHDSPLTQSGGASWSGRDGDRDGTPEQETLAVRLPVASADAHTFQNRVSVVVLGMQAVMLAP